MRKLLLILIYLLLPWQVFATTTLYVDTDSVSPTHPTYSSLSAAITYLQGYNGGVFDDDFVIECSGSTADTLAVTISGITTATYDLTIRGQGVGIGGQLDVAKYRIDAVSTVHIGVLHIDAAIDLVVEDLQLKSTAGESYSAVVSWSGNAINGSSTFNRCLSVYDADGHSSPLGWSQYQVNAAGNLITTITNTIFIKQGTDPNMYGGWFESTVHLYNCIFTGFYSAVRRNSGTTTVTNTVAFNNDDDFDGTITADHCASDDGDGTDAVTPSDWSTVFQDVVNGDYRLISGSDLIGAGADLSAYFTTDITGATRSTPWDIGAFAYTTASGWSGTIYGITPAKIMDVPVSSISKVGGVQ